VVFVFGINPSEFIVLLVVAAVVLGPERLPEYAAQLARMVRELRKMAQGASTQIRSEMGPDFDDIDWRKLDPRQYDPRRIVRDALSDAWDPDDPLGLKAANGGTSPGRDFFGVDAAFHGEKPQADGGPDEWTPSRRASSRSDRERAREQIRQAEEGYQPSTYRPPSDVAPARPSGGPAFDPDAT
jgi:sec-independent protein translocase protein TatB